MDTDTAGRMSDERLAELLGEISGCLNGGVLPCIVWAHVCGLSDEARRARAAEERMARALLAAPSATTEWEDSASAGKTVYGCHSCRAEDPHYVVTDDRDDSWHAPDCAWAAARREARALLGDDHADD